MFIQKSNLKGMNVKLRWKLDAMKGDVQMLRIVIKVDAVSRETKKSILVQFLKNESLVH